MVDDKTSDIQDEVTKNTAAEKEYYRLKLQLQQIQKKHKSKSMYLAIFLLSIFCGFCIFVVEYYIEDKSISFSIISSILVSIFIGCLILLYCSLILEARENSIRRKMIDFEVTTIQDDAKEDIFENSIKISYKYLDQYYLQTREHAQRGFFVTLCVSIFGAILIGIGIIAMFLDHVAPSYITCASGIITEFIAAIFFYLYNKTVSSMSNYHNKLVLSQNVSIALKVAESLPEDEKATAKNTIINELLKDINTHLVKEDSKGDIIGS